MVKFFGIAVRLGITVVLFATLLYRLDTGRIVQVLSHGSLLLFAAATLVMAATLPFTAQRWHIILAGKIDAGPAILLRILFVGWFFNQVLPTGIGGDAVRAWRCHQRGAGLAMAIRSVLLDRASGYAVMVAIFAATLPGLLGFIRDPVQQRMLVLALGAAVAGLVALFLFDRLPTALLRLRPVALFADLSVEARRLFLGRPARSAAIFGLSAVATLLTILSIDLAGRCVNIELPFSRWLAIVPPVALFQLLPISLGGWGVREAALVIVLGALGIPGETALAGSLCIGLSQILVGLPGGLIWLNNWDIGSRAARSAAAGEVPDPARAGILAKTSPGKPQL